MKEMKRAIVALDLSDMDQQLLNYSKFIAETLGLKKIYFVHIIPNLVYPQHVDLSFHKSFSVASPVDEKVKSLLQEKVASTFNGSAKDIELEIEVVEGMPSRKILHWTEVKEVDLLITGKKTISEGSGITPRRIAQKANCNILLVPERATTTPKKILVPIDFSDYAARALQTALQVCSNHPESEVHAVNILSFPPRDYYYGLDKNPDYRIAYKNNAKKAYNKFMHQYDLAEDFIVPHFVQDSYDNTYKQLIEFVETASYDLVVMGAKGHSLFENFLFGSVTERFVQYSEDIPILIVR